jgi:hypothetical protein
MTTAVVNLNQLAAQWRTARRIYPIYSSLLRQFELGVAPCRELESPINRSEPEVMNRIKQWFADVDEKVQAYQLRQLLQTSQLGTEENLRALITRQLACPTKTKSIRDKVDFLMVQYYAHCSPHGSHEDLSFDHFADVLHPLLGDVSPLLPPFCSQLDDLLAILEKCDSLGDLLKQEIIDKARNVKELAEEKYFSPSVLVAVARFNYMLRLGFFRLMHADLHAIRLAIHEMEARGQVHCDCSSAGLSKVELLTDVRQICHEWKNPFRAAYSAGNNFKQLVEIRAAVEKALAQPAPALPVMPAAAESASKQDEPIQRDVPIQAVPQPIPAPSAAPKAQVAQAAAEAAPVTRKKMEPTPVRPSESVLPDLEGCLEIIAEQLLKATPQAVPVSNVMLQGTKLLLASWEVAAFVRGGDDACDALQRAVAARAILNLAFDSKKRGEAVDMSTPIGLAHQEAAQIQERIAEAKDAKNIDAAVNLAASAKRLLSMIDEAEKLK